MLSTLISSRTDNENYFNKKKPISVKFTKLAEKECGRKKLESEYKRVRLMSETL